MNTFFTKLFLCCAGIILLFPFAYGSNNSPLYYYPSDNTSGVIGIEDSKPDNPADNIFQVRLTEPFSPSDRIWLVYELDGLEDYHSVSRSVNDQLATGGYMVKKRSGYKDQREEINPNWLKQGSNIIRFTIPASAPYFYKVRNLRFEMEKGSGPRETLVVDEPVLYEKEVYVRGFISGEVNDNTKLLINGRETKLFNGEFESVFAREEGQRKINVEAILGDGTKLFRELLLKDTLGADFKFDFSRSYESAMKQFALEKTSTLSVGRAQIIVPAGALKSNMFISITTLRELDIPAMDMGMVNVTSGSAAYRFLPHGSGFEKELQMAIGFDPAMIPDGYTEKDIRTFFFDEESRHWTELPFDSVNVESLTAYSRSNHFTDIINAIIKVPEAPEAEAYNSTSMKGIKAANPTLGVTLVDPPSANSMGSANLSYPISLPAGRNGMEPHLSIDYNSEGGNGWMGLGWNLHVPAIGIETRWGVPRYDSGKETETYQLNGEQLTPLSHRSAPVARSSEKQFYPRVEGSFDKVIRHGGDPKSYWWEVTDKNGTRYFYGGTSGVDNNAVLKDDNGNIARWCLVEVRDLNNNNIKYEYNPVNDFGTLDNQAPGRQIYVSKIHYTGNGGSNGNYTVEFITDTPGDTRRTDVLISGNNGLKEVTAELLRKVNITFNNQKVRSYELVYTQGAFFKTLLSTIKEFDAAGKFFNEHEFSYFDEVRNSGGVYNPYENETPWSINKDNINANFITSQFGFKDNATALSGNKSTDFSFGMAVTVGLNDDELTCKSMTVGGNFGFSKSTGKGLLCMIDINGDNLPDKVFVEGSGFWYRPNLSGITGNASFGDKLPLKGINDFYKEKNNTLSGGVEASLGTCSEVSVFIGLNATTTNSTISIYFSDVNGDQLLDIVVEGQAFFSRIDSDGNPLFTPSSSGTPSPIFESLPPLPGLFKPDQQALDNAMKQNPLQDIVTMWEAPYDGNVSINAPIQLLHGSDESPVDGIKAVIQVKDSPIWSQSIKGNDTLTIWPTPSGLQSNVLKGDRIYFRLQSNVNGEFDQVSWNPIIKYTDHDTNRLDADNRKIYSFEHSQDFILSADNEIGMPLDGEITIQGSFIKSLQQLSDDIHAEIIDRKTGLPVWSATYLANQAANDSYNFTLQVTQGMSYSFRATTSTNIDWASIQWNNFIFYTQKPAVSIYPVPSFSVFAEPSLAARTFRTSPNDTITVTPDLDFNPLSAPGDIVLSVKQVNKLLAKQTLHVAIDGSVSGGPLTVTIPSAEDFYIEYFCSDPDLSSKIIKHDVKNTPERTETLTVPDGGSVNWTAPDKATIDIMPVLTGSLTGSGPSTIHNGITLMVTRQDGTVSQKDYDFPLSSPTSLNLNVDSLEVLSLKYVNNNPSRISLSSEAVEISFVSEHEITVPLSLLVQDKTFGPFYRQWGHFAYNGNGDRATQPINETELVLDKASLQANSKANLSTTDLASLQSSAATEPVYNPATANFIVLVPDGSKKVWMGYDHEVWVNATTSSSSRMGQDDLTQDNPVPSSTGGSSGIGSGRWGVKKMTKSDELGYSLGASVGSGFSVGGAYCQSFGKMEIISDFMDMNGDRYPDVVTKEMIQYTGPLGGISNNLLSLSGDEHHLSNNEADGITISGSYVNPKAEGTTVSLSKNSKTQVGSAKAGGGLSGTYGKSKDNTKFTFNDLNGDGLPDKLYKEDDGLHVSLNLGYAFAPKEKWYDGGGIGNGASTCESAGLGVNVGNGSISGGVGLSRSDNHSEQYLQDVNGDGLTDLLNVAGSGQVKVNLNTGSGFASAIDWTGATDISLSSSTGESANVAFTICFAIYEVKICVNPSTGVGRGMSVTKQEITDVDGDGFPDYLSSDDEDNLKVKRSTIGKTNLLKSVKRPLGAALVMDYKREGNTYQMPNSVWVLSAVNVNDGFAGDGADNMKNTFTYESGFYERNERDFYGFAKVHTFSHDTENGDAIYTEVVEQFSNTNFYEKGMLLRETFADKNGNLFTEKVNTYTPFDGISGGAFSSDLSKEVNASVFPALTKTESFFYEGQPTAGKSTSMTYKYGPYGNITEYEDLGDVSSSDNLKAVISYHENTSNYLVGVPKDITVTGSGGTYRHRTSDVDPSTGNLKSIQQFLADGTSAQYDMKYNSLGNMISITRPANATGQRFSLDYTYDSDVQTYIVKRQNSYGYTSTCAYDPRFGQMTESKDMNGQVITYNLDDIGRVIQITGPYEGNGFTLKFEYHPEATVPWALTDHYDPQFPNNTMQTSTFVDGLGRVLQTKKDGSLFTGDNTSDEEKMIVSGRVLFDAFGRTTTAYYPVVETLGNQGVFNSNFDSQNPSTTTYDVMNRSLSTTLPDGAVSTIVYGFDADRDGAQQFSTLVTDANGKKTQQFTDVRGRATATKNFNSGAAVWTSFVYNAINELTSSMNDLGHVSTHEYDMLGRKIKGVHPDAGQTDYQYDLAGNLTSVQTANLKSSSGMITYAYDFERLTTITYPENPQNNVTYTYGDANAQFNRVGRVVTQEDVTGAQEFFYGKLGEVIKNVRTVMIPNHDEFTFTSQFTYDTWNRLTEMIYPDGEKVTYTYNTGGLLSTMQGVKSSASFPYINQLGYDKFEQRVFLAYGNGTKTNYSYEADRRRLHNMTAETAGKRNFMDNDYTYDKVSNILSLENKAPVPSSNLMGGSSMYTYHYDDLYRLTKAEGNYTGPAVQHRYSLNMQYNSVGGITQKTQTHDKSGGSGGSWVKQNKTTYTFSYAYSNADHANAPSHIGDKTYSYDANGNQKGWDDDKSGQRRNMIWDEENRLMALSDNGATSSYFYDAQGIRVLKASAGGQAVFLNSKMAGGGGGTGNFTVYVNPYLVLRSGSYTKHYYIESQKIVSKLGDTPNLGMNSTRAGEGTIDYTNKRGKIWTTIVKNLKFLGADGQILTAGKSGKIPPGQLNDAGSTGSGLNEKMRFFYHPDHVGSTSYITDANGEVYQHLEYFAFGETFVEEHSNTWRTPYLFNGKELDDETGLYYYGARYYDPVTSVWQSVDPDQSDYPFWSAYNFTMNNPVNCIDPNGLKTYKKVWNGYTFKFKNQSVEISKRGAGKVTMDFSGGKDRVSIPLLVTNTSSEIATAANIQDAQTQDPSFIQDPTFVQNFDQMMNQSFDGTTSGQLLLNYLEANNDVNLVILGNFNDGFVQGDNAGIWRRLGNDRQSYPRNGSLKDQLINFTKERAQTIKNKYFFPRSVPRSPWPRPLTGHQMK
jgi:RHS repeat-associated protein